MATVVRIIYDVDKNEVIEATQAVNQLDAANEEATKSTKELGDESEEAGKEIKGFSDVVNDLLGQVSVLGINLKDASEQFRAVAKSTGIWGVALKALPIVAVVGALTSMVSFLTSTKRGQDALRVSTSQLSAAFAELRDNASQVGERVFNDLSRRSTQLIRGINGLTRAVTGSSAALAEEARIAGILEQRLILTEDAERNLRVARAEANVEIEQQKLIAEDVTRTFEEREAAAARALELETSLLQEEEKIASRFVQILKEQQALGENTREDLEALAEAEIRLAELQITSTTRQIELNNKLNQIRKDGAQTVQQETEFELEKVNVVQQTQDEISDILAEADEERRIRLNQQVEDLKAAEDAKVDIARTSARLQSEQLANAFDVISSTLNDFNVVSKEVAIAQATISTFEGANKALSQLGAFGPIVAAAIIATGLANVATIAATDVPAFAEGVLDLDGPGTGTSDSIPAMLSKGESVMTAQETADFLPTLKAMRKGDVDPEILNNVAQGREPVVIDATKTIETSGTYFSMDEDGFSQFVINKGHSIKTKQNRYSPRVFS